MRLFSKTAGPLVLALLGALTPLNTLAAPSCAGVWKITPTFATSWPLNHQDRFRDIQITDQVVFPRRRIHHVLHGDFQPMRLRGVSVEVAGIEGGLHTRLALQSFLKQRPDLRETINAHPELQASYPNGVLKVFFPMDAFANQSNMSTRSVRTSAGFITTGTKSFFPPHWSDRQVLTAIRHVIQSGRVVKDSRNPSVPRPGDGLLYRIEGEFGGVRIAVVLRNGTPPTVYSAYPAGDQGQAALPISRREPLSLKNEPMKRWNPSAKPVKGPASPREPSSPQPSFAI